MVSDEILVNVLTDAHKVVGILIFLRERSQTTFLDA